MVLDDVLVTLYDMQAIKFTRHNCGFDCNSGLRKMWW